jgi:hypothetical protein
MCRDGGDLWGFLKEVDEAMKRYTKSIEENQQRFEMRYIHVPPFFTLLHQGRRLGGHIC